MKGIKYNLIAQVLEQKGKTSYWLANVLGVAYATATRWSNNQSQPPLPVLNEIAAALKVDVRKLLVQSNEVEKQLPERFMEIQERAKRPQKRPGRRRKED